VHHQNTASKEIRERGGRYGVDVIRTKTVRGQSTTALCYVREGTALTKRYLTLVSG
jgi:hypothetical protein